MNQKQQGGDGSFNIQAGHDVNLTLIAEADKRDFGIIDEIFKSVVQKLRISKGKIDREYVNLDKKIELNFPNKKERNRVRQYFKYAYTKISLIERRIQEEDPEIQNDIQGLVFNKYNSLKDSGLQSIEILEKLFEQFVIPKKEKNAEYSNLTRAFILFFFDDCTIFEKTSEEK